MKRKPLSMKKLYEYLVEYIVKDYAIAADRNKNNGKNMLGAEELRAISTDKKKQILDYIDYIWKNPK
jgi:hypothetical protein